jgi:hypothetical protein
MIFLVRHRVNCRFRELKLLLRLPGLQALMVIAHLLVDRQPLLKMAIAHHHHHRREEGAD